MYKKTIKNTILLLLAILLLPIVSASAVFANNDTSMFVSPTYQNMILIPGESYKSSIEVSNPDSMERNLHYSVTIGSFSQVNDGSSNDDYGNFDVSSVSQFNQIMDWITLDRSSGVVEPNHKDEIGFTISVPENAPAGGQYATIIVSNDTEKMEASGNGVGVQSTFQLASIIYAEVIGDTDKSADILENSIPSFMSTGPLTATAMVQNNGNVHTDAKFTLQVWPLFSDEEICTNEEDPDTSFVLPKTSRFHSSTCNLPLFGIFRAKQTVRIFGEESVVEKTIIVCPIWLLFIILFVIILFVVWILTRTKSKKSSKKAEN